MSKPRFTAEQIEQLNEREEMIRQQSHPYARKTRRFNTAHPDATHLVEVLVYDERVPLHDDGIPRMRSVVARHVFIDQEGDLVGDAVAMGENLGLHVTFRALAPKDSV